MVERGGVGSTGGEAIPSLSADAFISLLVSFLSVYLCNRLAPGTVKSPAFHRFVLCSALNCRNRIALRWVLGRCSANTVLCYFLFIFVRSLDKKKKSGFGKRRHFGA